MADPSTADVQAELKEYLNSKNINRCVRKSERGLRVLIPTTYVDSCYLSTTSCRVY